MCGINIILSDIPELLVLRVARAMIQECQTGRQHQSTSAQHHHRQLHAWAASWLLFGALQGVALVSFS